MNNLQHAMHMDAREGLLVLGCSNSLNTASCNTRLQSALLPRVYMQLVPGLLYSHVMVAPA
jgi:hypothetical protein